MKFAAWFTRRKQREQELDEEIRAHLAMAVRERIERGADPAEAEMNARREFGNATLVKEVTREMWGWGWHDKLIQDSRFGLRQLRRSPGFTAVTVMTLALGIGANAAIFSIIYDVLLKPLPYPQPDQLVWVGRSQPPFPPNWYLPFSGPNFLDLRDQNHVFQSMSAFFYGDYSLTGRGQPDNVAAALVTANFFKLLGIEPMLGREFLPGEDQKGHDHEVIFSYDFWQRKYGGKRDVIGKIVDLNEQIYTVVGVMPRGFAYPSSADEIWIPLVVPMTMRGNNSYRAIARLKPGVTLAQARANLSTIAHRLALEYPESNDQEGVLLMSLQQRKGEFIRTTLLILLGTVGLVLLIACANVANLSLARGARRQREMAVRAAMGAGRRTLLAQLLTESVLLALAGGAAGLLVAHWGIDLLRVLKPNDIPDLKTIGLNFPVLWFTLGVSIATGIVFGLAPGFQITRLQLNDALKASGNSQGGSVESGRTRNALVAAEVALSLALLAGAGLLIRSFARFTGLDPGFDPHQMLRFSISLPQAKYRTSARVEEFYRQVLDRTEALPGVESAAITYPAPPSGGESDGGFYIEGHKPSSPSAEPDATWHTISPGYFHAMRTAILAGRAFSRQDTAKSLPVAIINQTLARHFVRHENPIGKRLYVEMDGNWVQVVGVAADQAYAGWDSLYDDEIYFPFAQAPWPQMDFVVRTKITPLSVVPEIRKAIWSVDKNLPIVGIQTMEQALDDAYAPRRFDMALLLAFALLAATLAAIGIYGVMSYSVAQRTREMGIRVALGAQKGDVLRLVVQQGMAVTLVGVGIGIAGALVLTRFLSSMLYGVKPTDPVTFLLVSLLLCAIALLACYIPARRAAKVDPMVALRHE